MKKIELFQINAFTDKMFHGNPTAVCLTEAWLNDELLQAITLENNMSETIFVMEGKQGFEIRWFTPSGEVKVYGHAALAAGFLMFELGKAKGDSVRFLSALGELFVYKKQGRLSMSFPRMECESIELTPHIASLINKPCAELYESDLDYLMLLGDKHDLLTAQVDLKHLIKLPKRGLVLTAPGDDFDCYVRCFFPKLGISEDPVSGSAYALLSPFWSSRLNKKHIHAKQGSLRSGEIFCDLQDTHVQLSGYCRWYSKGFLVL